ncbi:MAG: hybrid sensor histidine kinase/response regulator [Pseudodesulfovibrio sp.]
MVDNGDIVSRILVVEDSRAIAQELQRSIEAVFPVRVDVAQSYADALAHLDRTEENPFLAILDLNLADAPDGEVVDLFCARSAPCLVFTSDVAPETRSRMLAKGIIDYVVKDSRAVANILDYIRRLRRNREVHALVVEDSPSFRLLLCTLLRRQMLRVTEVADGESALAALDAEPSMGLIIIDYLMEGMDGVELVRAIRARHRREGLPIIAISSSRDPLLTARFIKHGASDFLAKPFEAEEFYCRVNHNVDLAEAFRQLSKANQVKNQFLGMVAHDLRSPISGINGLTEMLLDNVCGELNQDQREVIGFIHAANLSMNGMVGDLLDISVIEAGQLRLVREIGDLAEVAARAVRFHSLAARAKTIAIETRLGKVAPFAFDSRRVAQVLDNLLTNAIKFSSPGTTVRVTLEQADGQAVVSVVDQGQGVPPGEVGLLFQSYRKTSVRPTAGETSTGLGLVITKKIVEAHGGTIRVESEFGHGATFRFTLPLT